MPKFCPTCGKPLQFENAEICPSCGVRIPTQSVQIKGEKSAGTAALLSFFFTGLGQVYNGDLKRGLLFLIGTFVGLLFFIIPGLIVWVYQIYDAYSTAKKMSSGEIPFKEANTTEMILYVVLVFVAIVIFILLAAVIAAFVFGMSGNIAKTKVVALTAIQQGNNIIITNQGGQDAGELSRIEYGIGTTDHQWISPKIGESVTFSGGTSGKDHVIASGTFKDGVQQVLLDSYV